MATQPLAHYTPEQYLALDRSSEFRNEYIYGEIVPMVGGTPAHCAISGNAYYEFRTRISSSGCRVYNSELRVCLSEEMIYGYPT